jgi:hypothetical protein
VRGAERHSLQLSIARETTRSVVEQVSDEVFSEGAESAKGKSQYKLLIVNRARRTGLGRRG